MVYLSLDLTLLHSVPLAAPIVLIFLLRLQKDLATFSEKNGPNSSLVQGWCHGTSTTNESNENFPLSNDL